ncbi:MAG: radical SAM family heme chaperone HemW [Aquificota bacterium]|nr:MAG: radical SAM family heme chaperone HemW [Aquificota bacterium]
MVKALYFHIPFCRYKCPYCDFVSFVDPFADHGEYMNLLLKEAKLYSELEVKAESLYFGGGSPSLVKPKLYERFLSELLKLFDLGEVREVSIECNPEDYTLEDFKSLKSLGFNRISFGVQSLRDEGLKALGRLHSVEDALRAVERAHKAGFENINIDLIFGYPSQTLKDLKEELKLALSLPIKHLSCYLLTPYEDTRFGELYRKGELSLPSQDLIGEMYETIADTLEGAGFVHYEVSNFALEGYECRHNLAYWSHEDFLGFGVSAWSFIKPVRFGNTKNIKTYKQSILEGKKPVEYREELTGKELLYDYLFVALRTNRGVPEGLLSPPKELEDFFERHQGRLRLNRKGFLLINDVLLKIRDCL